MRPEPSEEDIQWLVNEASKYLSPDLHLRRQDVLSAWSGIRPLAIDPHNNDAETGVVSRDHVVSYNPESGVVFVSGGKWTTYREMAEDAIDKIIATQPILKARGLPKSRTLTTGLVGLIGYYNRLEIHLMQEYKRQVILKNLILHFQKKFFVFLYHEFLSGSDLPKRSWVTCAYFTA